ncbi:hypothetical protein [Parasitella parasitica]|uniref:CCR4-NOT transcription complex subunit 11 n=1 Tax=Parasitella parasitica TaxID=35722 RepID=A0A0B7NEU5_9FUNG|nr:hypothetical protein [Parasitella parasitica]
MAGCAVISVCQADPATGFLLAHVLLTEAVGDEESPKLQQYSVKSYQIMSPQAPSAKLAILYILYSCYATVPLENNPFLTFFLQLLEDLPPLSAEQHFVYCILEETLSRVDHALPQDVYNEPSNKLPAIQRNQKSIDLLRLKVARLIDDPDIVILNDYTKQLLSDACHRTLSLSENETLRNEKLSDYPLTSCIAPQKLPNLVDLNQFFALNVVPLLLRSHSASLYLQALLEAPVTINSLEVIHHILVSNISVSQEFLHYYISKSIRSCDELEEGPKRDRQVKQVVRFVQSLVEKNIIPMTDYFIEIQAFCVSYMKLKGVTNLFRLASNEAQKQTVLNQQDNSGNFATLK